MNRKHRVRYNGRINSLDIPPLYQNAQVGDFSPDILKKALNASFITGAIGCGKTHLLCAIAQKTVMDSRESPTLFVEYKGDDHGTLTAIYIPAVELIANIQLGMSNEIEKTKEDYIRLFCLTRNLYIDDFGVHTGTDWEFSIFARIIDYRYSHMLKTTIASNLSFEQLANSYSKRIASRLLGMGKILKVKGEDKRVEEHK